MEEKLNEVALKRGEQLITKVWIDKPALIDQINTMKAQPTAQEIKINKFADNSKYLPIGLVEAKLDHYFNGLWETKNFVYSVIVNEITCSITLRVFIQAAGCWIERVGTASVQIQLKAQYEMVEGKKVKKEVDVLDASKKIANTLAKDLPHAKAEAIKNAAKSLGAIFGRDLNREFEDVNEEISLEKAEEEIVAIETQKELKAYYESLPKAIRSDTNFKQLLKRQEEFIKNKKQ